MKTFISDSIKYIGVDDLTLDLFEGQYAIPHGVSYNSYLVVDEKIAIMDSVDVRKQDEWLCNLERELDGRTPDYLIVQHMEPDHTGSVAAVAEKYPQMKIVASAKAVQMAQVVSSTPPSTSSRQSGFTSFSHSRSCSSLGIISAINF